MTKRSILTIIFLIGIFTLSYSQETEDFARKKKPVRGFNYAKSTLGANAGVNIFSNIKSQSGFEHKYEYEQNSFTWGIDVAWNISQRSAIASGFNFWSVKYKANYKWIYNISDPSIPVSSDIKLNYFSIPVNYNYAFVAGSKFSAYLIAGFSPSFYSSSSGSAMYADNSTRDFDFIEKFIWSYQVGAGIQYRISSFSALRLQGVFQYFQKGFDSIMYQKPGAMSFTFSFVTRTDWKCWFNGKAWKPWPRCD